MLQLWYYLPGLAVVLSCTFSGTNAQSYSSGSQSYNNYYYPTSAPASTAIVTTTSPPASQAPVTNSNTAPGGAPSNPIFGTNGTLCDTRTAFAAIGCPCMLVNKTCADPNSLCTATSSTSGRKKRLAQRGRKGSPMGNAAKNQCKCKTGFKYDSSSNTCQVDCSYQFCTTAPTESAYLQGPFVRSQTFLLFSGPCVLEYKEDYNGNKINVQTTPQSISSYFGQFGQSGFNGPVTVAYDTIDANSDYTLNLVDATGKVLSCTTSQTVSTGGLTCSTPPAVTPTGTKALTVATSASTQLDQRFNPVVTAQYVIIPGNKELALYNMDFSTQTGAPTTGFLQGGQTRITSISAIQIIQDQDNANPNPALLAVFGTDANGVPYLGYADAATLQGVINTPGVFLRESVPLASQFEGRLTC